MTDSDEECTICLEVINHESMTGVITGCSHYYHQACILQWSSNSNACPTCRNNYNSVKLKRKNSQKYHGLVQIPNRVLQNDAINDIPREFIISANCPRGNIPHQLPSDGICMVCSSVDYLSSSRAVIACGTCGSNFHQGCLGMLTVEDEIIWYCPLCDSRQIYDSPNTSLSPANTRIRSLMGPRWHGSHRCKELEGYSRITRDTYNELSRRRSGLIIHNENNELDDDFLHDGDVETERPKINGGTILRKELRAKQMLTKDEALSWDLFEEARSTSNTTPHYSIHETNSERNILRRKRKKITPILSASPGSYSGTRPSRISILINQLKRSENKDSKLPGSTLVGYDTLSTPGRSIRSGNDSKGLKVNKAPDVSLSLEQKQEVQKYVRDRLKPLYQPNAPDGERETLIKSQEEYVKINKKVSRRIYCYILSLGEFSNIFEDEQCLKSIIYQHLDEVLKLLSISN